MRKYIKKLWLLALGTALMIECVQSIRAESENIGTIQTTESLPDLRIGCDEYEPYNYFDENGDIVGIDADLAEEACHRMGYEPLYIIMKWTEKEEFLKNGVIDCIWDSYSMNGREDEYSWSDPYMYSREAVLVNKGSSISKLTDLNGKNITTLVNTRAEDILLETTKFPQIFPQNVYSFQQMGECLAALRQNYVDAAAGDVLYLKTYMKNYPDEFEMIQESLETSRLAVAFSKDADPELVTQLNNVLKEMRKDGTTERILSKYEVSEENLAGEETGSE